MADIYIFDSPLAALDAKVARRVFNNAIGVCNQNILYKEFLRLA